MLSAEQIQMQPEAFQQLNAFLVAQEELSDQERVSISETGISAVTNAFCCCEIHLWLLNHGWLGKCSTASSYTCIPFLPCFPSSVFAETLLAAASVHCSSSFLSLAKKSFLSRSGHSRWGDLEGNSGAAPAWSSAFLDS